MYHVRTVYLADEGNNDDFGDFGDACQYAAHLHAHGVYCVIRETEDGSNPRNGNIVKTGRACVAEEIGTLRIVKG